MSISQEARYRLKTIKYAERFGVARAAAQYHASPSSIYRWRKIYRESGNNIKSLEKTSTRPLSHSRAHNPAEVKLIRDIRRRNPNIGLQDLWLKLRGRGYKRSMSGLYKELITLGLTTNPKSKPSPTYRKLKPYEQMTDPGERVQIDVKYVPKECLAPEFIERYGSYELYQYTAIDEYSRYRILCGYREHNTYSSSLFLCQVYSQFKALGIEVKCVQTDNGAEFTKSFHTKDENNHSLFENTAKRLGIKLKRIKPHTPRHNGKVERSHREDQKRLYSEMIRLNHLIIDEESFTRKLKRYQDRSNNRPMRPLGYKSPKQVLEEYLKQHKDHNNYK